MKIRCMALAALALLTLGAAPPIDEKAAAETLAQAWKLLEGQKYRRAAGAFQKAYELSGKTCGACLVGLSRAQHAAGNRKEAVEAARSATAVLTRPDSLAQAWNQLGVALLGDKKQDLAAAEAAFRKAVELGGEGGSLARYNLAELLARAERHAEALEAARSYLQAEPQGFTARSARIVLCQAKKITDPPFLDPESLPEGTLCTPDQVRLPPVAGKEVDRDAVKVTPPRRIHGNPPFYTRQARQDRARGTVILESIIDEEGCVRNLHICRSVHPDLDKVSSEVIAGWVFEPALLDGKEPVKVYYTLSVNFTP